MAHGPLVEYFALKGLVPFYQKEDSDLRELKKKMYTCIIQPPYFLLSGNRQ